MAQLASHEVADKLETQRLASPNSDYRHDIMRSLAQVSQLEDEWDDLWNRSLSPVPSARAELVRQWMMQFTPGKRTRAIVVFDQNDRLVGALPLVEMKVGRLLRVGTLPCNAWSPGGDLLLDPASDLEAVAGQIADACRELPWRLLWLDDALPNRLDWNVLAKAMQHRYPTHYHPRFDVAVIPTIADLGKYSTCWSKNHRKSLSRSLRRLEEDHGAVSFELASPSSAAEVETLIRQGFEIEDRSWKGENGSSVIRTEGMLEFYTRQAQLLSQQGHLALAFLRAGEQTLAFEYGWVSKETYFSFKVGYDEAFATYGPGQLLVYLMLERFCRHPEYRGIDCLGPASEAIQRWKPETYETGRLVVGTGKSGALLAKAYGWARNRKGRGRATPGSDELAT